MKTGLDMVNDVYKVLGSSAIRALITGKLWKLQRPKNSAVEDIVINSLAATATQIQEGVVNVNIHAPNLQGVVINGNSDDTMPDVNRLNDISKVALGLLDNFNGTDFRLNAQVSPNPFRDDDGTWYINIRVSYFHFIQKFKNI